MQIAAAILTNSLDTNFRRMIDSLPESITHCLVFDNTAEGHSETFWTQQCGRPTRGVAHSGIIRSFAAARNQLLALAGDTEIEWVLFIDSDEVCDFDEMAVRKVITEALSSDSTAVELRRSDVFHGRVLSYGEAGRQRLVRFMKAGCAAYQGSTHESVQISGKIYRSQLHILHYSHEDIAAFLAAISGYAQRIGQEQKEPRFLLLIKLLSFPVGKWLYNLLLREGWRDGWHGLVYATMMSMHSLLVRLYQYEKRIAS